MLINRPATDIYTVKYFNFLGTGGSIIINPWWALTAAHCAPPVSEGYPEVHRHPTLDLALLKLPSKRLEWAVMSSVTDRAFISLVASGYFGTGDVNKYPLEQIKPQIQQIVVAYNIIEYLTDTYISWVFNNYNNEGAVQPHDSGGGVFDINYHLLGIIVSGDTGNPARLGAKSYALRVDTPLVQDWIKRITADYNMDGSVDVKDFNILASQGGDTEAFNILASRYGT